ncbi:MAG: hypothetical protein ACRDZ3_12130 [Acidimicrobiia bacterium]
MTTSNTWRRRLTGLGLIALVAVSLLASGAGADEDFVAGSGRARASIFEIVPRTGGLTLPVSFGRANASFQGTAADASSTAIRAPEGSAAPMAECGDRNPGGGAPGGGGGGSAPSPTSNPFASTLKVSSEDEDGEAGRRASSLAAPEGSPVQGAMSEQEVSATRAPSARGVTVEGRFGVAEIFGYTQARAEASAGVVEDKAREASAVVTLDRLNLLDGQVVLERLRWEATQRTGDGPADEGLFSVGRITVAGTPLPAMPTGDGSNPFEGVNAALAPTGLALAAPQVEKTDGVVRVTPMTVQISDSPIGRSALGPVLGALQPVRDPLVEQLLGFSCDFGAVVTAADVVTSIASGSGGLSFDVGGVSASTEGERYDNPFDGPLGDPFGAPAPPPPLSNDFVAPPPAEDFLADPLPVSDPVVLPDYSFSPTPEAISPAPAPDPQSFGLAQPAFGPSSRRTAGTRGGTALAVGALGLFGVLALAAADAIHLRRSARTIP